MDQNQADQILMMYSSKLPAASMNTVRERLLACQDATSVNMAMAQLKDPTTSLILSILLGPLGVDRFYIGDVGLGIGKLITCGGCDIWWIIDIFLIMDATRAKNLQAFMTMVR